MDSQMITAIVASVFASTGFWAFVTAIIQKKDKKNDVVSAEGKMLRGLAHDRICYLGEVYINQGWVSKDDYENLHDYLYVPYTALGGNGTAKRIMQEVEKLPLKESKT